MNSLPMLRPAKSSLLATLRLASAGRAHEAWTAAARAVRVRGHQVIYDQADASDAVYVLLAGVVRCLRGARQATYHVLSFAAPAVFGERDLLAGLPAQETVMADEPCLIATFDCAHFLAEWHRDARLRQWLTADMLTRYARTVAAFEVQRSPLPARLEMLLSERVAHGEAEVPSLTQLAGWLGASEKSLRHAVKVLETRGLLIVSESGGRRLRLGRARRSEAGRLSWAHTLVPEPHSSDGIG